MAILGVFRNFFGYCQNDKNNALFAKFFCALFCCICNGIYTLYILICVRYLQTNRFYFVRQRKTALKRKVNDYVLILAWGSISILPRPYPRFVYLFRCNIH